MSFLHSTFIENTQEAREWLENLGYIGLGFYQTKPFLYSSFSERANINRRWQEPWYATEAYELITDNKIVDCRGNLPLFKAITALRDDSGYMQWFWRETLDENDKYVVQWILNDDNCKYDINESDGGVYQRYIWSRATLEELIEHFKTKKV